MGVPPERGRRGAAKTTTDLATKTTDFDRFHTDLVYQGGGLCRLRGGLVSTNKFVPGVVIQVGVGVLVRGVAECVFFLQPRGDKAPQTGRGRAASEALSRCR